MKTLEYMLPMEDGVRLYTLVFLPEGDGPHSAVFIRTPYDPKPTKESIEGARASCRGYVENGFAAVWQHCRGRGGSEGEFVPFKGERADGLKTLSWLEKQPFFDGRVYLVGGSYLAYVHLSYLAVAPACVKGAALSVMGADGSRAFFKDGQFKADLGPMWYMGVYRHHLLTHGTERATYDAEFRKYPLSGFPKRAWGQEVPSLTAAMALRDDPLSDVGGYSEAYYAMKSCPVPVLLLDGWSEMYLNDMTHMWQDLPEEIRAQSAFIVGPWSHGGHVQENWTWPFPGGELEGDPNLDWILHLRDGRPPRLSEPGMAKYYHVGTGRWETGPDLPQGEREKVFHMTAGRALAESAPEEGEIRWISDPEDPPFFSGGPDTFITQPAGFAPQPEPNFRDDVISFVTEPFRQDAAIRGRARVRLQVSCGCEAAAFVARLCCADEKQTVVMQAGAAEIPEAAPGEKQEIAITLDPVCWTVRAGERLRLDISCADAMSYFVHPQVRGDWRETAYCKRAEMALLFPGCRLELPV